MVTLVDDSVISIGRCKDCRRYSRYALDCVFSPCWGCHPYRNMRFYGVAPYRALWRCVVRWWNATRRK
jgi:hypothetical protein